MKKGLFLLLLVPLCFAGCSKETGALPEPLRITGDVVLELFITADSDFETVEILDGGSKKRCIPMPELLSSAKISGEIESVYFCSPDGVIANIPFEQMDRIFIARGAGGGWECIAPDHPPQANIKKLDKIVVKAGKPDEEGRCIRILNGAEIVRTITYGSLFEQTAEQVLVYEGDAKKNGASVTSLTRRSLVPITSGPSETAVAYFGDGSQHEIETDGYLEWRGNTADYIEADGKGRIKDVIGIWTDAPEACVTDIAETALSKLQSGRVLIVELDGVGYDTILAAAKKGTVPFLSDKEIQKARTVMPSVSSVALASILTGLPPCDNGVFKEGIRQYGEGVMDIFDLAANMGKTSAIVEGNSALVKTSIDQMLNPDLNGSGGTDDEVFASAKKTLSEGTDLTYVHFHGFDDIAHTFGPSSAEAFLKLSELDAYIQSLCEAFSGTVIVCSDHGMHEIDTKAKRGEHGSFLPEDLTVPIIVFEVRS